MCSLRFVVMVLEVYLFDLLTVILFGLQPECSALLEALQQCCLLTSIPTMLAKSLHRVLQLASDATIRSFQLLDATTVLSQVMEHQRQVKHIILDTHLR